MTQPAIFGRPRAWRRFLCTGLLGLSLFACGNPPHMTDPTQLVDVLRVFQQAHRWQSWQQAMPYINPDFAPQWLAARTQHGQAQITEYQVVQVLPGADPARDAEVIVQVEYYVPPAMKIQGSVWQQRWQKADRGWQLTAEERLQNPAPTPAPTAPAWP